MHGPLVQHIRASYVQQSDLKLYLYRCRFACLLRQRHAGRIAQTIKPFNARRITSARSHENQDSTSDTDMPESEEARPRLLTAQLCLCGVALLWGTYSPSVRYLYATPGPPTPVALTAIRTVMQAVVLLATNSIASNQQSQSPSKLPPKRKPLRATEAPLIKSSSSRARPLRSLYRRLGESLNSTTDQLWVAGVELGLWNFCGSTFQALGLQYTSATRGAFLIQATALLTPVMATIAGDKASRAVWLGCCGTLAGTVLITLDHSAATAADPHSASNMGGDALILAAAFFYSLVTIRLGRNAQRFAAVRLATSKSVAIAAIAVAALPCAALWQRLDSGQAMQLWPGWQNPMAWVAITWSALGPGALVAFLQAQGQASVPAAQSQVIYSSVPVWSALLAFFFMPEETMGGVGYLGGAVIVLAGLLATR